MIAFVIIRLSILCRGLHRILDAPIKALSVISRLIRFEKRSWKVHSDFGLEDDSCLSMNDTCCPLKVAEALDGSLSSNVYYFST